MTGGCSCGAIRYRLGAKPLIVFEAFYNPAEVWPKESLARWRRNAERSK